MAADGTGVVGGGAVGGPLSKDGLLDAKCPEPIPNRRRSSSLSRDAQRRAYQWCREYLGGAWRRARPEELSVCPVRSGVSLTLLRVRLPSVLCGGRGGARGKGQGPVGVGCRGLPGGMGGPLGEGVQSGSHHSGRPLVSLTCVDLQRRPQQPALPMLATEPRAQYGRGAPGGAATAVRGYLAGEGE